MAPFTSYSLFIGTLLIINIAVTLVPIRKYIVTNQRRHSYSYIGKDFPLRHGDILLEPASMTLQESVHFGGNGSEIMAAYPLGAGRAIMGPDNRELLVSFVHQIHCVKTLQYGLFDRDNKEATPHHMKHCLDYLRQTILCAAQDTLEEGDFMEKNFKTQRVGGEMACWDWRPIYNSLDHDWLQFYLNSKVE